MNHTADGNRLVQERARLLGLRDLPGAEESLDAETASGVVKAWLRECLEKIVAKRKTGYAGSRVTVADAGTARSGRASGRFTPSPSDSAEEQVDFSLRMFESVSREFIPDLSEAHRCGLRLRFAPPSCFVGAEAPGKEYDSFFDWFEEDLRHLRESTKKDPKKIARVFILSGEASELRWTKDCVGSLVRCRNELKEQFQAHALCSPYMLTERDGQFFPKTGNGSYLLDFFNFSVASRKRIRLMNTLTRVPVHGVFSGRQLRLSSFHAPLSMDLPNAGGTGLLRFNCSHVFIMDEDKDAARVRANGCKKSSGEFAEQWFLLNTRRVIGKHFHPILKKFPTLAADNLAQAVDEIIGVLGTHNNAAAASVFGGTADQDQERMLLPLKTRLLAEHSVRLDKRADKDSENAGINRYFKRSSPEDPLFESFSPIEKLIVDALTMHHGDYAFSFGEDAEAFARYGACQCGLRYLISRERFSELIQERIQAYFVFMEEVKKKKIASKNDARLLAEYKQAVEASKLWLDSDAVDFFFQPENHKHIFHSSSS